MSKNQLIIELLEERQKDVKIWNYYSDGFKDGLQFAIDILKIGEDLVTSNVKEMEVVHV